MADEKLPKPDNVPPEPPSPRPTPNFSQDVIYAGAPIAAAHSDAVTPTAAASAPAAPVRSDAVTTAGPGPQPPPPRPEPAPKGIDRPHRSEVNLFFSWLAGVLVLIPCWSVGSSFLLYYLMRWFHLHFMAESVGVLVGPFFSFAALFLMERNLWLSRFMGLRLGPHSTQLKETLFFFVFGVAGLLLRSSDKPAPVAARPQMNDGTREIVETVVFVVVLVLLLKTFLVEAFVIPTGSMADTLLGYNKDYTCEKCGYKFVDNCSSEAEPQGNRGPERIIGGVCPNCRAPNIRK